MSPPTDRRKRRLWGAGAAVQGLNAKTAAGAAPRGESFRAGPAADLIPSRLRHITLGRRLFREGGDLLDYDRARTRLEKEMRACRMCPVACGARRADGERGACRVDDRVVVSSAFLHHGEEDVLVGTGGSGTIFLAGCNLHCVY